MRNASPRKDSGNSSIKQGERGKNVHGGETKGRKGEEKRIKSGENQAVSQCGNYLKVMPKVEHAQENRIPWGQLLHFLVEVSGERTQDRRPLLQ